MAVKRKMTLANEQHVGEFPSVTWDEVLQYPVTRLMMDPERIVEGPDRLD
jgi:hypothetical protein